jgi:hypothetical protein
LAGGFGRSAFGPSGRPEARTFSWHAEIARVSALGGGGREVMAMMAAVDRLAGPARNRSAVIERAVEEYVALQARRRRDARDLEILDRHAARLNREAADVLSYQADL